MDENSPNSKQWHVTIRLKKPLIQDFPCEPTKHNVYESLSDDLRTTPMEDLDKFFEIIIEEVTTNG